MNDWSRGHDTLVGTPLTSRLSGRRVAASEHCVAVIVTCACGERYLRTPREPHCPKGCPDVPRPTFDRAPTMVTGD